MGMPTLAWRTSHSHTPQPSATARAATSRGSMYDKT